MERVGGKPPARFLLGATPTTKKTAWDRSQAVLIMGQGSSDGAG